MNKRIGFIGTGNMGSAMIGGLIKTGTVNERQLYVSDRSKESLDRIQKSWKSINCSLDNKNTVENSDIVILAVKPQVYEAVIKEISSYWDNEKIIISIAAGITIDQMEKMFVKEVKIVRTMPNTPALVGEGVTAYCFNKHISEEEMEFLLPVFESFGIVEKIEEKFFHAVIAVSGSAPAYVFMFIEAMADAAVLQGLPRAQAYRMASQAVLGASKMVRDTGTHPGILKDAVCSPGGTTIEAVAALEEGGLRSTIINAMNKCAEKSKEMTNN